VRSTFTFVFRLFIADCLSILVDRPCIKIHVRIAFTSGCTATRIKDPGNNEETETGERSTMRWTVRS